MNDNDVNICGGKLSMDDLKNSMGNIDRNKVEKKLRDMGLKDIADKLSRTSNEEILDLISKNPELLKRLNQLMGGK